jgi:hypothetical protein
MVCLSEEHRSCSLQLLKKYVRARNTCDQQVGEDDREKKRLLLYKQEKHFDYRIIHFNCKLFVRTFLLSKTKLLLCWQASVFFSHEIDKFILIIESEQVLS